MNRQQQWEREAEREECERYREIMGFNRSSEERRAERIARARASKIQPRKLSEVLGSACV